MVWCTLIVGNRGTDGRVLHIRSYFFFLRKERPIIGFVSFQYFERTNEVFEFLLKRDNVESLESADSMLVELQGSQISIGTFMLTQCW
jgi:hypothetical protein